LKPICEELGEWSELPTIYPFTEDQILRIARTEPTLRDMLQQFRHLFDHVVFGESAGVAYEKIEETPAVAKGPLPAPAEVKSIVVVEAPMTPPAVPTGNLHDVWEQELRAARRKLEPEGALTGATRELQAGLGSFLQICHEHGVKVGPWRLQH